MLVLTAAGDLVTLTTGELVVTEPSSPPPDPTSGLGVQALGTSPLGGTA